MCKPRGTQVKKKVQKILVDIAWLCSVIAVQPSKIKLVSKSYLFSFKC